MARIAVGGFQHETNTFAPQQATWDDFVRADAWPRLAARAGDDRRGRGLQHPDRRRGEAAGRARPRDRAAVPGLRRRPPPMSPRTPTSGCGRCSTRTCASRGRSTPSISTCTARWWRRITEDGEGELLRRIRGIVGDDLPIVASLDYHANLTPEMAKLADGDGRLPHLSAHRHGGDRQARRRAARPAAEGEAAGLSRLSPARFPDPAGLAVHLHRAGQGHLRSGGRARGRREEPQPGHRQRHPHAGLPAGRHRPVRPGAGGLRPRQGSGRSRRRQARRGGEGAGEGVRRRAARSRRGGAARDRAVEEGEEADRAGRRAGQSRRRRHLRHGRPAGAR